MTSTLYPEFGQATETSTAEVFTVPLAQDMICGAAAIAIELRGEATKANVRHVYYLRDRSRIPFFKLSSQICLRRSTLRAFIADQELRKKKR